MNLMISMLFHAAFSCFFLAFFASAYIVCVYEDPIVPEQAASVTEKLGDYLIQVGF
jgi:hypothetical protein